MRHHRQRKSPRLKGYDYSREGAYFITICTHNRVHLFGHIADDEMHLSPVGEIAVARWDAIPDHYPDVDLDTFIVMPNHVHGILLLTGKSDFKTVLGRVINGYKGAVTAGVCRQHLGIIVWQSRYHDHIIRGETDLNRIRQYVLTNPARWQEDTFYD